MANSSINGWSPKQSAKKNLQGEPTLATRKVAEQEITNQGLLTEQFTLLNALSSSQHLEYEKISDTQDPFKLRLKIEVADQAVIAFTPYFTIPDSYLAWLEKQDLSASLMTFISLGFSLLMTIAAVIYMIIHYKTMRFSRGWLLTLIFIIIYTLNNLNMSPGFQAMTGGSSLTQTSLFELLFIHILTLLLGLSVYVSFAAGSLMWERSGWQPWPQWKEAHFGQEVFYGMGRGYLLCLFMLGVQQVLFYVAETRFDVWAINDPSDSPLNMLKPGLYPTLAWVAAISEEATFRLFGIILFKKLFKSNFLAILLPSIIWAASHTQYPIYPVYTRLIEVTIIGIIFGYAFLKYGFITALFAHASMDSILMGLSLLSLNDAGQALLGLGYILLPLLVGCFIAWLHGKRRRPLTPWEPPPRLAAR
ncbi:Sporulation-killing factor biosynthesis protein SkfC [compost metagenome]